MENVKQNEKKESTDAGEKKAEQEKNGEDSVVSEATSMNSAGKNEDEDDTVYNVVMNHEEQYSIWPSYRENPLGWHSVGKSGTKLECLTFIDNVWTDMRPLSLRKSMEEAAKKQSLQPKPSAKKHEKNEKNNEDNLVTYLSQGDHPVEVCIRPKKTMEAFRECLERGYINIKFTQTKGGTELGFELDEGVSDFSQADFENETGNVRLVGNLTLNYVLVQCIANIELQGLCGQGHLKPVSVRI